MALVITVSIKPFAVKGASGYVLSLKPNYFSQELWCYGDNEFKPVVSANDVIVTLNGVETSANVTV